MYVGLVCKYIIGVLQNNGIMIAIVNTVRIMPRDIGISGRMSRPRIRQDSNTYSPLESRKNSWSPGKMVIGKMVPGKMVRGKNGPRKNGPWEKSCPENWSPGNSETKNRGVGVEFRGVCGMLGCD